MGAERGTGRGVRSLETAPETRAAGMGGDPETLARIERRVLWLATSVVHHANHVRPNRSGIKVGGHQASSASMISIMTALWFAHLNAEDRVSVKPHASPVLHAISYLMGRLDRRTSPSSALTEACKATRAAPKIRSRSISRPATWGSGRPPRSGARWRTGT